MKKKSVAYLLWLLVGIFGGHCFYLGKVGKGVLYLCTGGLFLIGWLFDLFSLGNQVDLYNAVHFGGGNRNSNVNANSNVQNITINVPPSVQPTTQNTENQSK